MKPDNWFSVEPIDYDTFAISEYKHWERSHCYLLRGKDRSVLIDTGLGIGNLKRLVSYLTDKPITVLTTHVHWDHIGGHKDFHDLAVHSAERSWLDGGFPLTLDQVKKNLTCWPCDFPQWFFVDSYYVFQGPPQRILADGDRLNLGGRILDVIHTPGHSPGHCCFYEPERGYLFTGDLLYRGCLDAYYPSTDPVAYLHSLERIAELEVRRFLPGHYDMTLPPDLAVQARDAFRSLEAQAHLRHGEGYFNFENFQVHF